MKLFKKIKSGICLSEGVKTLKEFDELQEKIEKDINRMKVLSRKAEEFQLPDVDIVGRVETVEKIDEYIVAEDLKQEVSCPAIEDIYHNTYSEFEIKREDDILFYNLVQDDYSATGTANLRMFCYADAVELAKSRAREQIEKQKQKKIYTDLAKRQEKIAVVKEEKRWI